MTLEKRQLKKVKYITYDDRFSNDTVTKMITEKKKTRLKTRMQCKTKFKKKQNMKNEKLTQKKKKIQTGKKKKKRILD